MPRKQRFKPNRRPAIDDRDALAAKKAELDQRLAETPDGDMTTRLDLNARIEYLEHEIDKAATCQVDEHTCRQRECGKEAVWLVLPGAVPEDAGRQERRAIKVSHAISPEEAGGLMLCDEHVTIGFSAIKGEPMPPFWCVFRLQVGGVRLSGIVVQE